MAKTKRAEIVGKYEGRAVITLLEDGRLVQLVEAFSYIDKADTRWDVPAGAKVDGASIPQPLWSFVGGPFEGKYRNASVIHDWYCDLRSRPWKAVHLMFYEAMVTSGVSLSRAKLMYAAVYWGGPRWSETVVDNTQLVMEQYFESEKRGNRNYPMPIGEDGRPIRKGPYANLVRYETVISQYPFADSDLETLERSIKDDSLDLPEIERLVDTQVEPLTANKRHIPSPRNPI
jgi:hypothetical protein